MASRKRKSLSSILKTVSPSRTALSDLNPNVNELPTDETVHLDLIEKKKRRSSRRVSFAETYQVKEFLKDSDRKELGPWNDSQDDTTHQELPANEQANVQSDHAGPSGSHHDQAHRITGLETLLSGPIKQEAHSMTSVEQDPYGSPFKRAAQQLNQCPQNYNMEQRKNDINEISVKSSFLKSVIAADSSFAAPAFRSNASTSRQQAEDQEDRPRGSSFKNTFLQAIVAAEPSPSDALGSMKHQSQPRNVDPGMEFTNCYDPSDITNRYEGNKEKVGDITRIFGGQGDGFENDNGMDMTTCMGGFETMQKKLERPAAESTRIFDAENTNKMELTECLKGFGGISCSTNKSLGRTLNQTGNNLNFTQVFGKMSESDYADMPHESTARLLQRIDDAIAGSDCSGAETTGVDNSKTGHMNVLHSTRNNTQKSIALDTIQEVSSSTVSMLNSTCRDKSAVSASSVLEACTEDDEMDITTCSNYTKDIRIRSAQEEMYRSLDKNEVMCGVGNSVSAVKPKVVVSSSVVAKGSGGDHTRVLDQAADDSAEMEMTCAITQPLIKGNEVKEELPRAPALSDEDRTRVFTSEDTAMMEMTCVVSGASRSALNIESVHQQKMIPSSVASKVVSHTHYAKDANDSDDMEMTCAINQTLMTGSQAKGQLPQLTVVDDKDTTRVFNSDDTAAMEMTCAMNQPVIIGSQSRGKPQTLQATSNEDKTRVFNSDDTAAMEMTCAMNQPVIIGSQSRGKPQTLQATSNVDKTRVFNSDDTAAMEMTCAMNQPVIIGSQSRGKPQTLQATSNEDKTRVFNSDDTAAMEMTCVMNQPVIIGSQSRGKPQILQATSNEDKTRVFNSDDTAAMEMTCAMNQPVIIGSQSRGKPQTLQATSNVDKTRVFNSDDTAAMEMTCAMNQPVIIGSQSRGKPQILQATSNEDKTRVFNSDDTAAMEMTCAMNQPVIIGSQSRGKPQILQATSNEDKTRVFNSDDTAAMEMTCAMSGVNTSAFSFRNKHQSKILSSAGLSSSGREHASSFASGLTHLVDNDTNKATEDTTTCFENTTYLRKLPEGLAYQMRTRKGKQGMDILQNDDTACMEMTECVSAPPSIFSSENADLPTNKEHGTSQPKMMRQQDYENTKIYDDENTGHMEMTTCIDALPSTKIKGKACRDDQTHVFNNEDTANMEMTCVGVVLPPLSKAKKIPKNISEEPTHISQSEDPSTNMESTACVLSGNSTLTVNAHAGRPVNSDVLGKTLLFSQSTCDDTGKNQTQSETSDVAFPRMKVEQMILPQFSTESEMKKTQQTTQVIDVSAVINTEQSLRDTDDFKIQEKNAAGEEIHQKDGEINISGDIPHDKTSDTYTLTHPALQQDEDNQLGEELAAQEKLQQGRNLDTFTINNSSVTGSGKRKLSSLTEGMSQRSTSASSEEGKSKANEEGSSSSPDSESHASFVLKDSIILPDWIDAEDEKGILDELPIDNDNTEDLCMTSNKRQRIDDAVFTSSYMDASHLTSNLSHLPLSSERGSTSVEDFLQMLFKFNDLPMGKRSVMCPTKITEPSTLSNQLEDTCVIKPKADMYEWAIKFLTPTVQELRKSVASQDPKHFEENVPIVKELQSAGPERCSEILEKGKNLEKYCKASSKTKMKGWRLQMIKNTRTAMQDSSQHFGNKLAKVTSSISTIEELLQQLNSVESSLDDAIKSIEEMKLPSEGEKSEWIANQQRLELMETNLKEQERAVQETECKRRRLEGEVKSLEDSTMKLEAEQEILSRSGKVTNQSETDIENMKSEILLLQSLQEWRLQAFQENNYKFSSLGKSILLHIKYGDKERGNKLIDVTLHSVLAHDACSSAKLAHSLFFSSVNTDQLKTLYPTYNDLPQMMQHMSELVGQVRLLEAEVSRIDFWHPVTTTHNRLSIEFSSIETHCMLCIHLDLLPGQYPFTRIPHSSIIKIGKISEKAISDTIDAVQPGWGYISRITKGIEQLLLKHST
ncbi:uncharacterized protein LOC129264423 [Lytechinus pictus]|uniref:uncharacterized protein LOC129264423 n=1 Tax=Lytechinus pictus TaxID=7653 RepID=UPI0030B9D95E